MAEVSIHELETKKN